MTWFFDLSGETMDVYDHNGNLVQADIDIGGSWVGDYPNGVLELMADTANEEWENDQPYARRCVTQAIREDIEEGTPP